MLVAKLKEALAKSEKPERKQQAASWKVFKAAEPGAGGAIMYVSVDPSGRQGRRLHVSHHHHRGVSGRRPARSTRQYLDVSANPSANKLTLTLLQDLCK